VVAKSRLIKQFADATPMAADELDKNFK